MKKIILKKIVSWTAILLFLALIILPLQSWAAVLNWENPNQGGDRQFKFSSSNISASSLMMSVVGCTGAVNRVSKAVNGFLQDLQDEVSSSEFWVGKTAADEFKEQKIQTYDEKAKDELEESNTLDECLNGIAYSLAKNQLTKMTRDAVNWINSGFEGDPMYVRDITSFTNSFERNILEYGINELIDPDNAYPYGADFSRSLVSNYRSGGFRSGVKGLERSLISDLSSFLTDPNTYYSDINTGYSSGSYSRVSKENLDTTKKVLNNIIESLYNNRTFPDHYGIGFKVGDKENIEHILSQIEIKVLIEPYYIENTQNLLDRILIAFDNEYNYSDYYPSTEITTEEIQITIGVLNSIVLGSEYGNTGSYRSVGTYGTETTKNAQQRSKEALDRFSNDFAVGGWDAWLAFTQRDQNNPLGSTLALSQKLLEEQEAQKEAMNNELLTNDGFLSQKKCVLWRVYDEKGKPITDGEGTQETSRSRYSDYDVCAKYETVTPGSIIKDNISSYMTSAQRQVELADTINESLNALFTMLVQKFQGQGLSSLSSFTTDIPDWSQSSYGIGSNKVFDAFGNDIGMGSSYQQNYRGFDLTKDLGNTYTRSIYDGTWNARTNTPELLPGIGIKNHYYIVSEGGKDPGLLPTIGADKTLDTWARGDRVFFDGEKWKKGVPNRIIDKKGIIQIQQDYIKEATKLIGVLNDRDNGVMIKLGELDYCIPGPNPNWSSNSADIRDVYFDYINGFRSVEKPKDLIEQIISFWTNLTSLGLWENEGSIQVLFVPDWSMYQSFFDGTDLWGKIINARPQMPFFTLFNLVPYKDKDDKEAGIVKIPGPQYDIVLDNNYALNILDIQFGTSNIDAKERTSTMIDKQIRFWEDYVSKVGQEYRDKINAKYGNKSPTGMLTQSYWNGVTQVENSNYLEMAQAGLSLTRNIVAYDENIKETTSELEYAIDNARANIFKLNQIKERVDEIVKEAQKRRDDKEQEAGLDKIKAECLEEELINYIEE